MEICSDLSHAIQQQPTPKKYEYQNENEEDISDHVHNNIIFSSQSEIKGILLVRVQINGTVCKIMTNFLPLF